MVTLGLALAIFSCNRQADYLDYDRAIPYVRYDNADVGEILRSLFRETGENYAVESDVKGLVNLELKQTPFTIVLKKVLDQVHASSTKDHTVTFVENAPAGPTKDDVLARKLPAYDFRKVGVGDAISVVFKEARINYRHSTINGSFVGLMMKEGTVQEDLEILLPLAKCKSDYTHGHFELVPESEERPLREVLRKPVHGIDFLDVDAKDAFSTFFKQIGAEYVLAPNIDQRFTLHLSDTSFENALDALCRLTHTTYQLRGTVYQIEPRSFQ